MVGLGDVPAGAAEHVPVERFGERRDRALRVPRTRGGGDEGREARRRRLPVSEVAPVRDKVTERARLEAGAGRALEVGRRVGQSAREAEPAARAGADVEVQPGLREAPRLLGEGVVGVVAPGEGDGLLGKLGHELGVLEDDVTPELHAQPALGHGALERVDVLQVHAPLATRLDGGARGSQPDVERLVEPDVEERAVEGLEQLVV